LLRLLHLFSFTKPTNLCPSCENRSLHEIYYVLFICLAYLRPSLLSSIIKASKLPLYSITLSFWDSMWIGTSFLWIHVGWYCTASCTSMQLQVGMKAALKIRYWASSPFCKQLSSSVNDEHNFLSLIFQTSLHPYAIKLKLPWMGSRNDPFWLHSSKLFSVFW